jgi:lipopolysaccharide export system permease protein
MKKIDKLILKSFIGPFILTFLVVVFILLMQHMLKYFDDIIGKGLGWDVVGQLLFYFAIFMTPVAMPLAVLLSSLITFGNLGEHFELTAIKSAGISLLRALRPIFFFVLMLTGLAFYANNYLVPKAALEAYSLLYDIKQKKPALDLREGTFYNGIPDISIKVNKKFPEDEDALKEIIVYDHRKNDGNKEVTIADSGRMSTILNERYLKFELFNGYNYTEGANDERELTGNRNASPESLTRSKFSKTEVVFDLSSYDLKRTDKKWFESNRIMRNMGELDHDIDSINMEISQQHLNYYTYRPTYFSYYRKRETLALPPHIETFRKTRDSLNVLKYHQEEKARNHVNDNDQATEVVAEAAPAPRATIVPKAPETHQPPSNVRRLLTLRRSTESQDSAVAKKIIPRDSASLARYKADSLTLALVDSLFATGPKLAAVQAATNMARQVKSQVENINVSIDTYDTELVVFEIQWHKILASSMACIAMFLIGAPLGAIIKRGGLGVPFLVSILFFIVYYLLSMQGEKLAKQGAVAAWLGVWAADLILLVIGSIFLRQARIDARLFDADFYRVVFDRARQWIKARRMQTRIAS